MANKNNTYAVYCDNAVYGIGSTPEMALVDAEDSIGGEFSYQDHSAHRYTMDSTDGQIQVRRCTPSLYAHVEAHGSPLLFEIDADGSLALCDEAE